MWIWLSAPAIDRWRTSTRTTCSTQGYVCAMRKDHPLAKPNLTVEAFAAADHLVISWSGDATSATDQALHQLGLTRRVALTVNHFASAVPIVMETNLIAILPTDYIH